MTDFKIGKLYRVKLNAVLAIVRFKQWRKCYNRSADYCQNVNKSRF